MTKHNAMLGWDVGGAHLKAALVDAEGHALQVLQVPCPLWLGLHELNDAVEKIQDKLSHVPEKHAVTMTGELADIFPDRDSGVLQIAEIMNTQLHCVPHYYAGAKGLVPCADIASHLKQIASANWLASVGFVASHVEQGLFIDIGSTTADLTLFTGGQAQNRGLTDAERMQFEELVYTGIVRTPLMSLASKVAFGGEWQTLMAEHFATTADIYRLTGELLEPEDMSDTADGGSKTPHDSARRLARMVGCDFDDAPQHVWLELARGFRQAQIDHLKDAAFRAYSRNIVDAQAPIVGAGAGSFLAAELARQLGRPYIDVQSLIKGYSEPCRRWAAVCLPAYSVACMLR